MGRRNLSGVSVAIKSSLCGSLNLLYTNFVSSAHEWLVSGTMLPTTIKYIKNA
jgi:hypothetical protein